MTDAELDALIARLRDSHCDTCDTRLITERYLCSCPHTPAADALTSLRAERDALRKDALRYRWLRDNCQYQEGISPVLRSDSANELDAAIDADLAGAKA